MERRDIDIAFERGMQDARAENDDNPFQDDTLRESWRRGYELWHQVWDEENRDVIDGPDTEQ